MSFKLVPETDKILLTEANEYVFKNTEESWDLATKMVNFMKTNNGVGLAANQIGIPFKLFVLENDPPIACFNPNIVDVGDKEEYQEEGCLTYPGLFVKIKRPVSIKIRYQDADGQWHTEKFTGLTARIIQHEMDYLNGIRFFDRATKYHRDKAFNKWRF